VASVVSLVRSVASVVSFGGSAVSAIPSARLLFQGFHSALL
jgi:hypothetical protein